MTHDPEAFGRLHAASEGVPGSDEVAPGLRWYIVQSFLALWEEGRENLADRLAAHVEKAIREAREVTTWAFPEPVAEARADEFSRALVRDWLGRQPDGLAELTALGDRLSLAQLALKFALPGIPDLYQGAEGPLHQLTDPDNRMAVDWAGLDAPATPFAVAKASLTRRLLGLRAEGAFDGPVTVEGKARSWRLGREGPAGRLTLAFALDGADPVAIDWAPRSQGQPILLATRAAR